MDINKPLISIIVPVYNVEDYLRRCLDSIINQTYKNLEIILVDDGSTDKSGKICDEYKAKDDRIIVIHQRNQGLSAARNAGLDIFKGEYVSFVDSDDYVNLRFIDSMYRLIYDNNVNMSVCSYRMEGWQCILPNKLIDYNYIIDNTVDVAWAKLYKSFIFKHTRFPSGKIHEDHYIYAQVAFTAKKIVCTKQILYYYCQRNDSITQSTNRKITFDREICMLSSLRFLTKIDVKNAIISDKFSYILYLIQRKLHNDKVDKQARRDCVLYLNETYNIIKKRFSFKTKFKFRFPYLFFIIRSIKNKIYNRE